MDVPQFESTGRVEVLKLRSQLLSFLRKQFEEHGYWECQTPVLSDERVLDAYIDLFEATDQSGHRWFLQSSPEAHMKRLIASGADAIFQICPAMRLGEKGRLHNPEFTMVEWYRVGDTYHDQMDFAENLVVGFFNQACHLLDDSQSSKGIAIEQIPQMGRPFARLTYDEVFKRCVGQSILGRSGEELVRLAESHDVALPSGISMDNSAACRDAILNVLLAEVVEPKLRDAGPTFVFDYPASQAALARVRDQGDSHAVAERFELYVAGIELCNGYQELTDADEFDRRTQAAIAERADVTPFPSKLSRAHHGSPTAPNGENLDAGTGLPECSGVALGFDRLLMLALGQPSIQAVMAFDHDNA